MRDLSKSIFFISIRVDFIEDNMTSFGNSVGINWNLENVGKRNILVACELRNTGKQTSLMTCELRNTGTGTILVTCELRNTGTGTSLVTCELRNTGTGTSLDLYFGCLALA